MSATLAQLVRRVRSQMAPNADAGDPSLLARWLEGADQAAFELLVWRHGPMVWDTCRRIARHEHDAEEAFQAALKQEGLTIDDLRRQLERQMLVSRVQQDEVMGKISISEDEVKQYYEGSKESFTTQPQITLREILISVPTSDRGVNVAEDDAAKEKAEEIRKRLQAGEPFAQLASDLSDAAVFGLAATDRTSRLTVSGIALGWALLNAIALWAVLS